MRTENENRERVRPPKGTEQNEKWLQDIFVDSYEEALKAFIYNLRKINLDFMRCLKKGKEERKVSPLEELIEAVAGW